MLANQSFIGRGQQAFSKVRGTIDAADWKMAPNVIVAKQRGLKVERAMRLIFFSAERAEVELVHQELTAAGIACEIHEGCGFLPSVLAGKTESEVWILNEEDSHRAVMLCVQLGVGFAKRSHKAEELAA